MLIDLNTVPHEVDGEPLPDLNAAPTSSAMLLDLNIALREGSEELLPDLNQGVADDGGDEIQYLHEDPFHLINEAAVHALKGQSHYLQKKQDNGVHAFDLNIPASEVQEESSFEGIAVEKAHQQDGHINFDSPHDQDNFDFNLEAADQQHEMQQMINMIEDMDDYGVYADAVNIVFEEEELEDSDVEQVERTNTNVSRKCRNLTDDERKQIYEALLERSNRGKLKRNTTKIVADMFQVSRYQVRCVWRRAKECRAQGIPVDVRSRRKNCGRKRKQVDLSNVLRVELHRRRTIRSLSKAIGVKKSTLHRWFKEGLLRRHSSTLKPLLREDNKKDRLRWCISMLDERTLPHDPKFLEMDNIIHMDEKWFNTTTNNMKSYLLPDEEDPHRTVQNKNSIGKVMFLSAVGRPIYDDAGNCIFDGKIGLWPFVRKVQHSLVANVQNEFDNYDPDTLNRVFLTLQGCMIEVMKDGGGNRYKIPHIDKARLESLGMLPRRLGCDKKLYEDVLASLGD